jgi:imidazole glycerol-phosphate synthase subunit HisF
MLKRRLVPKLQMRARPVGGRERMVLVTTVRFDHVIEIGDPVSQARIYQAQAADELIFLDLDAGRHERSPLLEVIRAAAEEIFMPFAVGGGVQSVEDVRLLLANGADKVAINTAAVEDPGLITRVADTFGNQCVVASIDYRQHDGGGHRVWTRGGTTETMHSPVAWAKECASRGAGEILITSIDRDGTRKGLDLEVCAEVAATVDVPVIVAGGCGSTADFVAGFGAGGADAVAAGTFFAFRDENLMQTRSQIANAGVPIRQHR